MGIPFEYNLCQFKKLNERDPIHGNSEDNYTLQCIRRSILDAFWSIDTSMVSVNFKRLKRDYFDSAEALITRRPVPIIGINKVRDRVGMGCAIQTMDALCRKGKCQDQLQCDLMRKTHTWYKNAFEAGAGYLDGGVICSENCKKVYE